MSLGCALAGVGWHLMPLGDRWMKVGIGPFHMSFGHRGVSAKLG